MKKSVFPDFASVLDAVQPHEPVLIAGCTASGKSALALQIAQAQGGVIVNADAMQVYDNWSVLTARPPAADLAIAPHLLYGHVAKDTAYTVGDWLRDIAPVLTGQARPIIVGGTGLFFRALTEGLVDIPPIPGDIRADARMILQDHGIDALLADLDADTQAHIDIQNPARVGRAWEVLRATGRSIRDWQAMTPPPLLPLDAAFAIHLDADPNWLQQRILQRFDLMIAHGALDEARANLPGWDPTLLSSKAIGAPELIAHLSGNIDLDTAKSRSVIATRQYAKRQRTWFRKRMQTWGTIVLPV